MKLVGITGTGSGKLGSSVFSVNSGQQIVRQYQPVVANPNTVGQVQQRGSFKLASQLAAAFAPVIAIPKKGMVTGRNQFIQKNMPFITSAGGTAQVTYENIQLTNGSLGLPAIVATRSQENGIRVSLADNAASSVSRVVYIVYRKSSEDQLILVGSQIVEGGGENGNFPAIFPYYDGDIALFAYGMKDTSSKASAKYGNYAVQNASDIAKLILSRSISMSDFAFTQTRGNTIFEGENETTTTGAGEVFVYATAQGNGTVALAVDGETLGTGTSVRKAVAEGAQVTATATAGTNSTFTGWYTNDGDNSERLSTDASYTFAADATKDIVAIFSNNNSGLPGDLGNG